MAQAAVHTPNVIEKLVYQAVHFATVDKTMHLVRQRRPAPNFFAAIR